MESKYIYKTKLLNAREQVGGCHREVLEGGGNGQIVSDFVSRFRF